MASKHIFDMLVVTGTYTNRDGQQKKRYQRIGAVYEGEYGMFARMDKWFNPAGVATEGDSLMISFSEPKDWSGSKTQQAPQRTQRSQSRNDGYFDDDIPF